VVADICGLKKGLREKTITVYGKAVVSSMYHWIKENAQKCLKTTLKAIFFTYTRPSTEREREKKIKKN